MPYILIIVFLVLLIINYIGSGFDFFNPAFIFIFMNLLSALVCAVAVRVYEYELHLNTVLVLSCGGIVFTMVNLFVMFFTKHKRKARALGVYGSRLTPIRIRSYWIVIFIIFELIVAYATMRYVMNVVKAFEGSSYDFATSIGRYNSIVKNYGEDLRGLEVKSGPIYKYGWPLCRLLCVFLGAILINNYILSKKASLLLVTATLLPVIISFFTGSRTTAFRFLTAFIAEYILIYRNYVGSYKKGNTRILRRLIIIMIPAIVGLAFTINLIGRATTKNTFEYFVAYLGGPFINLDIYLQNPYHSSFFGQETFQRLYSFVGSRFGIDFLRYDLNLPYNTWHGVYLGNVYTMYFMFIEDFGYLGIVPLTAVVALFYTCWYSRLMNLRASRSVIRPLLLVYAYLFNDVIMLTFSNRFYEYFLVSTSIRIYLWMIPLWYCYKKGLFRSGLIYHDE